MAAPSRKILDHLRIGFPQPISDRVHRAYFVHSMMRAVDMLKSERPILGEHTVLDYAGARACHLPDRTSTVEADTQELVEHCSGLTLWEHQCAKQNGVPL